MIMELGIECVAEGAENEEQVRLLQQFGCNIIQGYFYSKPVTLDVFTSEFVEKQGINCDSQFYIQCSY